MTRRGQIAPTQGYKLDLVDDRLNGLERLSDTLQNRRRAWEQAADEPAARTAVQLGLASEPD